MNEFQSGAVSSRQVIAQAKPCFLLMQLTMSKHAKQLRAFSGYGRINDPHTATGVDALKVTPSEMIKIVWRLHPPSSRKLLRGRI